MNHLLTWFPAISRARTPTRLATVTNSLSSVQTIRWRPWLSCVSWLGANSLNEPSLSLLGTAAQLGPALALRERLYFRDSGASGLCARVRSSWLCEWTPGLRTRRSGELSSQKALESILG